MFLSMPISTNAHFVQFLREEFQEQYEEFFSPQRLVLLLKNREVATQGHIIAVGCKYSDVNHRFFRERHTSFVTNRASKPCFVLI